MSTITSSGTSSFADGLATAELLNVMSDGYTLALFDNAGTLGYNASPDGTTFSAPAAVPGAIVSTSVGAVTALASNELLVLLAGATLVAKVFQYHTSDHSLTLVSSTTLSPDSTATAYTLLDATSDIIVAACAASAGGKIAVGRAAAPWTSLTGSVSVRVTSTASQIAGLSAVETTSFIYVSYFDTTLKMIRMIPFAKSGLTVTVNTAAIETAASFASASTVHTKSIVEIDGKLTIIANVDGQLFYLRRTAANSYSSPYALYGSTLAGQAPRVLYDAGGANLYVVYPSQQNQPTGEIYQLGRVSGTWQPPVLVAGGDSAGYAHPVVASVFNYTGSVGYVASAANYSYYHQTPAAAPLAPTGVGPSGNVAGLTPTLVGTYRASAAGDIKKSSQWLVKQGATVMWDSGEVVSPAESILYGSVGSPTALVYDTTYTVQRRDKDSLSASGAGTFGPYSSAVSFTPRRAATIAINTVTSDSITSSSSPSIIEAPEIQVHATVTQADGHAADSYQLILYAADAITLFLSSGFQAFVTPLASGAAFDSIDWLPAGLVNGAIYFLAVQTTDHTTGLVSTSGLWQLTADWTPPATPTGFDVTTDDTAGTATAVWSSANPVTLEWRIYDETGTTPGAWTTIAAGKTGTGLIFLPQPQRLYDVRAYATDVVGVASTPTTPVQIELGLAYDCFGIWITSVDDITQAAPMGFPYDDTYDQLAATGMLDVISFVPMGSTKPTHSFGLRTDIQLQSLKFWWPAVTDSTPSIAATTIAAIISALYTAHRPVIYRDRRYWLYCAMTSWTPQPDADVNILGALSLEETRFTDDMPVIVTDILE